MVGLDGDGVQTDGLVDRELLDEGAERRADVRAVQIGPAVVVEVRGRVGGERGAGGVVVEQVVDENAKGCAHVGISPWSIAPSGSAASARP